MKMLKTLIAVVVLASTVTAAHAGYRINSFGGTSGEHPTLPSKAGTPPVSVSEC